MLITYRIGNALNGDIVYDKKQQQIKIENFRLKNQRDARIVLQVLHGKAIKILRTTGGKRSTRQVTVLSEEIWNLFDQEKGFVDFSIDWMYDVFSKEITNPTLNTKYLVERLQAFALENYTGKTIDIIEIAIKINRKTNQHLMLQFSKLGLRGHARKNSWINRNIILDDSVPDWKAYISKRKLDDEDRRIIREKKAVYYED